MNMFGLVIHTDGFGASVLFVRRKIKETKEKAVLEIVDLQKNEIEQLVLPVTVDPGSKKVFTATITHDQDNQEFRRCSAKERISFAGSDRRRQKVERLKVVTSVKTIESQIPTSKTINIDRLEQHIRYVLSNLQSLFRFYSQKSAPFRFYDYQGRKRSTAEMGNILVVGGKKYNKEKRKKTNRNKRRRRRKRSSRSLRWTYNTSLSIPAKRSCIQENWISKIQQSSSDPVWRWFER
jgi:hypothetical protein